ncbi:MAG: magnesium transporter [Alphaproteobacteria bacterium]|nr:magnesium transporter [Alphaproteobacteria bacterium]
MADTQELEPTGTQTADAVATPPTLSIEWIDQVEALLDAGNADEVRELVEPLPPADVADLVEALAPDDRVTLVQVLGDALDAEVLPELDSTVRDEVLEALAPEQVAAAVADLETDDALEVVADLEPEQREELLARLPEADQVLLRQGLTYPEYTAGRLMQRDLLAVPGFWTVGDTIDFLRASSDLPDDFYDIFVVDPRHRPIGQLALSRILRNRRQVLIANIMEAVTDPFVVTMDQEDLAHQFRQQNLTSAPIVGEDGRLLGVVTIDDIVDVIDEEHEDDLLRMGGVSEDDLYEATFDTTKARFQWLFVNLGTAVMASAVISLFEATIEQVVALAVLMPIVASMGGNAGTQTLTVAVRALAMRQLTRRNALRVVGKEVMVGCINGMAFAVIAGVLSGLWFDSPLLGAVIAIAMVVNLIVAGFFGVAIPVGLDALKIDPAVASSVLLTTVTDVVGFFAFLGLAAWLLL